MRKATFKTTSFVLSILIVLSSCILGSFATENPYPESEHNYADNFSFEWYYEYPQQVDGLYVTFSEDTSFEEESWHEVVNGDECGREYKNGDSIQISNDNYYKNASGKDLAGKTLYIEGNSFYIQMQTDNSITDYGFKIERISDIPPDDVVILKYEFCDNCNSSKVLCYRESEEIIAEKIQSRCEHSEGAFVCWTNENGEKFYPGEKLDFHSYNLKPEFIPLLLNHDEVLKFSNSTENFNVDGNAGYYLSVSDYQMMMKNIYKVFGASVIPALGLSLALTTYPNWEFNGSCYGMSTVVFLQHYGLIDLLKDKDGYTVSSSLSKLNRDANLISTINYYQWSAAGSFFCENFALNPGTEMYSKQLKDMFESVSNGNIVMLSYYPGRFLFESYGHTVLLTGAYTQKDGTHVLVAYDCNNPYDYMFQEFDRRFYISEDFSKIGHGHEYPEYYAAEIGAFNWTDDYSHFEAFDIDGEGNVISWYSHFFAQMYKLFVNLFSLMV